jgi:hypothetical protein
MNMDSLPNQSRLRPATRSDFARFKPEPVVRVFYQLDIPCPMAALGEDMDDMDGATHVLLMFPNFEDAKRVQLEMAAKGVHGEIVKREYRKEGA